MAETRDGQDHQARVDVRHGVRTEAKPLQDVRSEVFDHNIGVPEVGEESFGRPSLFRSSVMRHASRQDYGIDGILS